MSEQVGHTPGPWRAGVCNAEDEAERRGEFEVACVPHHMYGSSVFAPGEYYSDSVAEHEANCRLIAAAPELLAACKALQMEAAARGCGLRIADEAIIKAEGR